jgi:hypothetical protein
MDGKPSIKGRVFRTRHRWKANIKLYLREARREDNVNELAQELQGRKFLDQLSN